MCVIVIIIIISCYLVNSQTQSFKQLKLSSCLEEPKTNLQMYTASILTHKYRVTGSHIFRKCWEVLIDCSQQSKLCKQENEN